MPYIYIFEKVKDYLKTMLVCTYLIYMYVLVHTIELVSLFEHSLENIVVYQSVYCRDICFFLPQVFMTFEMHSLISIAGVVLSRKENYHEWSRKIKHTLIFNELWKGICEGEGDNAPEKPTSNKELSICKNKNNKAYALITTSINEDVSRHIYPFSNDFEA